MEQRTKTWDTGLDYAVLSDVGLRRTTNQDSYATVIAGGDGPWRQRGHLFIVADGMGAHAAGELASKLSVTHIPHLYQKLADEPPAAAIVKAVEMANAEIHGRGSANPDFHGMGTTTSCLVLAPEGALVAHIGDSRVYRLRGNRFEQLTFDHSLVWEMTARGQIPRDDAGVSIPKNIITRSLGPHAEVDVDLEGPFPLLVGDTFLMCSDGLSGQVKDEEMGIIIGSLSPQEAAQSLVSLANLRGGPDNITLLIIRIAGAHIAHGAAPTATVQAPPENGGPLPRPVLWGASAVGVVAAGALAVAGQVVAALIPGVLAVGCGIAAAMRRRVPPPRPVGTGQFGRAPYASGVAAPNAAFVEQLANIFQQLRDAATQKDWLIDWSQVLSFARQATTATQSHNHLLAVQAYCHGINFMMAELKAQQRRKKDASRTGELDG